MKPDDVYNKAYSFATACSLLLKRLQLKAKPSKSGDHMDVFMTESQYRESLSMIGYFIHLYRGAVDEIYIITQRSHGKSAYLRFLEETGLIEEDEK